MDRHETTRSALASNTFSLGRARAQFAPCTRLCGRHTALTRVFITLDAFDFKLLLIIKRNK